ncbi:glutamate--tRNA ligase [Salisaeta longa]|uniref:glutamate--tRNA ligase n=1 Tax=Salisaeta longa TaxID=503170 RepID=UPI0003B65080|nr:glutamate--tRNA ligase [Salisaeta longa]
MAPSDRPVRVRFAPSPTGFLHIGGLRTALYNYLFARKHEGTFILRIEDTDRSRYVEEAEADIQRALTWSGLAYDEGPGAEGPHAPYYQSERSALYRRYADTLIEEGHAYYAFDTEDELAAMREELATEANPQPTYNAATRMQMRNSLTLPDDEVEALLAKDTPHVIRLKVPRRETIQFTDEIRGTVSFEASGLDDQVLLKSDGMPTYHLANVVDDHHMEISHVIRGEEWLSSTPKHILMYRALGWTPPKMAHLPLILSPEGGKLSKRDANELGIPVYVRDYIEEGYEAEALVNFLAFLGWNPGTEQELFTLEELAEAFSLDRVGASGVQFDLDKLQWYNEQYVRKLSVEELVAKARPHVKAAGYDPSDETLHTVCDLMQDRITRVQDIATEAFYFFEDPDSYEPKDVKKRWKDDSADLLRMYADRLEAADTFDTDTVEALLRDLADAEDVGAGRIIHPARLAVSGRTYGPGVFGLLVGVGKEACIRRMRRAVEELG